MDVHDSATRSYNMSRIRSKDTKPELLVRKYLHSRGSRFRLHEKRLPGRPDIVLPKYRTVIDVRGCFWHGHEGCKYFVMPKTRREFWEDKIKSNQARDIRNDLKIEQLGWKLLIIWECDLKLHPDVVLESLTKVLNKEKC